MVHGKCVGGNENNFAIFEIKDGYAVVWQDSVELLTMWARIMKYESVADVSLLSDKFVNEMSARLRDTPVEKTDDTRRELSKENEEFLREIQDESLKQSRKNKIPVHI